MKVFICDIDGTIADNTHREHLAHIKAWDAFFEACDEDKPIVHMRVLLQGLSFSDYEGGYHQIVYVTGRPERVRAKTLAWIGQHGFPLANVMYMRKDGDHRPDHMVKFQILGQLHVDGYEPILAFDDRNQVVKMWRENGVPCLQVAEGDF
jgi:hypothetical protein